MAAEPAPAWKPENPRVHPIRVLVAWVISALALLLAAGIVPGAEVRGVGGAIVVAALVAVVNAIIPPILAALRLPFTIGIGFIAVLAADAAALLIAADAAPNELYVDGFASALG
ncbi:MAG TPA: phage holin family protein, partial [Gemmatimonadaceae bacterium]|nr:phage holin family protein [Gemmatimonadaceae bacterium]